MNSQLAKKVKSTTEHTRCMTTVEAAFCDFINKSKASGDHETVSNVFAKYGQMMCPELSTDACIKVAGSRFDFLMGTKTEKEWFNVLKNEIVEIEGRAISISRELIDADFYINNAEKNDESVYSAGKLIYDILTKDKTGGGTINIVRDEHHKSMYALLYLVRNNEGSNSAIGPEEFKSQMSYFFKHQCNKVESLSEIKQALNEMIELNFSLMADDGLVGKQFKLAESVKCDAESAKTKCKYMKEFADKCLFYSYVANAIGVKSETIKEMPFFHAGINNRIKKVLNKTSLSFDM